MIGEPIDVQFGMEGYLDESIYRSILIINIHSKKNTQKAILLRVRNRLGELLFHLEHYQFLLYSRNHTEVKMKNMIFHHKRQEYTKPTINTNNQWIHLIHSHLLNLVFELELHSEVWLID